MSDAKVNNYGLVISRIFCTRTEYIVNINFFPCRMDQRTKRPSWLESMRYWTRLWILVSKFSRAHLNSFAYKYKVQSCKIIAINGKAWRESCFLVLLFCRLGWEKSLFTSAGSPASLWILYRLSWFSANTARLEISKPVAYGWKGWRLFYGKRVNFILIESVRWTWS